jgi:ATP-dependent Clp protease adapter protein ClpS/Zn-dependent protease
MNIKRGYVKLIKIRGIPVFLHWSLPLGGLLISAWAGFNPYEAGYYSLAYLSLIFFHELGHLVVTRWCGLKVFALYLTGVNGECYIQIPNSSGQTFLIYTAGLIAQLLVFFAAVLYVVLTGPPHTTFGKCVLNTFTLINVLLFVLNLIPHKTKDGLASDGHVLWHLLLHRFNKADFPFPTSLAASHILPSETSLLSVKALVPNDFVAGIEILNDNKTPMAFVVSVLRTHLGISETDAVQLMIAIHTKGGQLIPLPTYDEALIVAQRISDEAKKNGHPLVCRAVDVQQAVPRDALASPART